MNNKFHVHTEYLYQISLLISHSPVFVSSRQPNQASSSKQYSFSSKVLNHQEHFRCKFPTKLYPMSPLNRKINLFPTLQTITASITSPVSLVQNQPAKGTRSMHVQTGFIHVLIHTTHKFSWQLLLFTIIRPYTLNIRIKSYCL